MTISSEIVRDTPGARCLRVLAPLVVLLGLAVLIMAPGIIAGLGHDDARPSRLVDRPAPAAPEG